LVHGSKMKSLTWLKYPLKGPKRALTVPKSNEKTPTDSKISWGFVF